MKKLNLEEVYQYVEQNIGNFHQKRIQSLDELKLSPDKGDYFKYCGQRFWEFISGNDNLFTEIIEPLGYKAKERNDEFIKSYSQTINKFTREFANIFCKDNGEIDWNKLVQFNSATEEPKKSD